MQLQSTPEHPGPGTSKRCTQCARLKPLASFYEYARGARGHSAACKECQREATRMRRAGEPRRRFGPALPEGCQQCRSCCRLLAYDAFARDVTATSGRRSDCRDCSAARSRAWREAHPGHAGAYSKRYHALHPDAVVAWNKHPSRQEYRAARREERRLAERERWKAMDQDKRAAITERGRRYRAMHAERLREQAKAWRMANPQRIRLSYQRRVLRYASAEGTFSATDIAALYARQGGCCAYCRQSIDAGYEIEHRRPLVRGGSNWPANLALSCQGCNRRKGTKTDEEFMCA